MLFCDVILICCICVKRNLNQDKVMTTASMQSTDEQDKYNQLLINTYLTKIMEASDDFYEVYYTIFPTVNSYSITVKEIPSDENVSIVTFTSKPYLGPHDSVGIDEITFTADYLGNVKLENFNHIISYSLPDNLKNLEKKRVPGKYHD